MIQTLIFYPASPTNNIDADALLRIVDQGEDNSLPRPPGAFFSEYTVFSSSFRDVSKCLDWLYSLNNQKLIKRVAVMVTSTYIGVEDILAVTHALLPYANSVYQDGTPCVVLGSQQDLVEDAFEDGAIASLDGIDQTSNPHSPASDSYAQWQEGHLVHA